VYKLYIANKNYSSWSLRPWVLLKELSIEFEEKLIPFIEGSNWEPFRSFCPSGTVPCLQDGELTVWDSMGIIEYLAESYTTVWPKELKARTWARCAAAEMHSGFSTLRNECPMNCGLRIRLNDITPALQHDVDRIEELWQQGLDRYGGPFLAGGKFTAVDAFFAPVAFRMQTYDLLQSETAKDYVRTLLSLESIKSWQGEALVEPWFEKAHEQEAKDSGKVLKDFREKK